MCEFRELKALRVKNKVTQEKISELIKISKTSYNKRENGNIEFTLDEIVNISMVFNLSPQQIYEFFLLPKLRQKQQSVS